MDEVVYQGESEEVFREITCLGLGVYRGKKGAGARRTPALTSRSG